MAYGGCVCCVLFRVQLGVLETIKLNTEYIHDIPHSADNTCGFVRTGEVPWESPGSVRTGEVPWESPGSVRTGEVPWESPGSVRTGEVPWESPGSVRCNGKNTHNTNLFFSSRL